MSTRRTALKTLAGATVVGSLSGCVQLATQRTVEYQGTPAWIVQSETRGGLATAVGVEGRKTVKRAEITREIVTHSWGMLYSKVKGYMTAGPPQAIATFTTPSIQIAGQELNPIKELTVGDIGDEFALSTEQIANISRFRYELSDTPTQDLTRTTVEDATGRKVLRAFRDSVGGGNQNIEYTDSWTAERTIPSWDGDTYNATIGGGEGPDVTPPGKVSIRFDKHDGDFVVLFSAASSEDRLYRPQGSIEKASSIMHPSGDKFTQAMLLQHLVKTNLNGSKGLVKQGRELIDETQDQLVSISRGRKGQLDALVSDTKADLERLDADMGEVMELINSTISTFDPVVEGGDNYGQQFERIITKAGEAVENAMKAHERVANYVENQDQEGTPLGQIETNLRKLVGLSRIIERVQENGRKTIKARDV